MATFNQKKIRRHSSVTVALTVLLIAAVILLNGIFGALVQRYGWYVNMNPTLRYPATDAFYTYVDTYVMSELTAGGEIRILFCEEAESLRASDETALVLATAEELAARYEGRVSIDYLNVVEQPKLARELGVDDSTDVVFLCGDRSKTCSLDEFYLFSSEDTSEPMAYSGHRRFATVLRSVVCSSLPVCYFTVNHGESFPDYEMLYAAADAGYDVKSLDLLYSEIPEDCAMLITYNPHRDFTHRDGVADTSELERLEAYMQSGGRYMVFVSADTFSAGGFSNLEGYLSEWGVTFAHETGNTGIEECYLVRDPAHALTTDGYTVLARVESEGKAADVLAPVLTESDATVAVSNATVIRPTEGKGEVIVTTLLSGYAGAEAWAAGRAVGRADEKGYAFMTLSERAVGEKTAYLLACSSTDFACEESMQSAVFDNKSVFMSVVAGMGKTDVPLHIAPQPIMDDTIRTMTTAYAHTVTWVAVLLPSVLLLAAGLWVLARRRYS